MHFHEISIFEITLAFSTFGSAACATNSRNWVVHFKWQFTDLVEEASEFIGRFVDTRWTARRRRKTVTSLFEGGRMEKTKRTESSSQGCLGWITWNSTYMSNPAEGNDVSAPYSSMIWDLKKMSRLKIRIRNSATIAQRENSLQPSVQRGGKATF